MYGVSMDSQGDESGMLERIRAWLARNPLRGAPPGDGLPDDDPPDRDG